MLLLIMASLAIIGYVEMTPLIKQARIKALILYCSIFTPAFLLCLLLTMNIKLPSPAPGLDKLMKILFKSFSFLFPQQ